MSISSRFRKLLSSSIDKPILGIKNHNNWNWINRNKLKNNIIYCIQVLKYNNIKVNHRVMYKGDNSINWISWNIATNAIGAIWVPLYANQTDSYVNHIINDCEPSLLISKENHHKNVRLQNDFIDPENYTHDIPINNDGIISNLIYTSGTTGKPKGVILTNDNILANIDAIETRFSNFTNEKQYTSLSILPWAHIYGMTAELYYNLLNNNRIAISSGPTEFVKEIREIKPDFLYLVPRVMQMIKTKIEIFDKPIINKILPYILNYVFGKNLQTIFMGGAQLDETTKHFYLNNGIMICEGYGCTETSPMISVNHNVEPRDINSVGKILDNLIVEIINDEICVSGPSVMAGYWDNTEATNEVLINHNDKIFYKTGDEGHIKNGFLYYNGRFKENYKLNNGKFVNINEIDNIVKQYTTLPFMVYGNNKRYNIIIIEENSNIDKTILNRINKKLKSFLHIKDILMIENNTFQQFMTPKMSLKRNELEKFLQDKINITYK
jgi:long-chain acyl-CoA synthetase